MVKVIKVMNIFLMNKHLQNVWESFNFNIFDDFRSHYLKKNVLLLADVFEKFNFACLKYYDLDPCHYFSAPGLSWDAMLKLIEVKLEKISDPDKYMFLNKKLEEELVILIKDIVKHLEVSISFI